MGKKAKKLLSVVLAAVLIVALAVPAFAEGEGGEGSSIKNGKYLLKDIVSSIGMFTIAQPAVVEINGEDAVLTLEAGETAAKRYDQIYIGNYEDITEENKDSIGVKGTLTKDGKAIEFSVPIKTAILSSDFNFVVRYQKGYPEHDGDWYKSKKSDNYYITPGALTSPELKVDNKYNMFKVKAAELIGNQLTVTMNSTAYDKVYIGHAELAEDASDEEVMDINPENPVFQMTVEDASQPFILAFHSKKNDEYYTRIFTINEEAGTLVTDTYTEPVTEIDAFETAEAAIEKKDTLATVDMVNSLIRAIKSQKRDDNTDKYCAVAKAYYDALTDEEKEQLIDPGYFGDDTGSAAADKAKEAERQAAKIGEKELLVVSFGTSFNESREKTILAVENALEEAYPDYSVRRAFTAQIIINHIASREGYTIDDMKGALDKAVAAGVKELVIQPTHLMHGAEYDEMNEVLAGYKDKFETLRVSEPLLNSYNDKMAVMQAVVGAAAKDAGYEDAAAAAKDGTAIVLMGHGTAHQANVTYADMQAIADNLYIDYNTYKCNVLVGTVEGEPESTEVNKVLAKVQDAGFTKVILRPLMVVAGDHANNDMAGDEEESWKSIFGAALGAENVKCQINGLGELKAAQDLYVQHVKDLDAKAGSAEVTAAVRNFEKADKFDIVPQKVTVAGDTAEKYGDPDNGDITKVTFADLLYTLHAKKYGKAFTKETAKNYIVVGPTGYLSKWFGVDTSAASYLVNESFNMVNGAYDTFLADGDQVDVFKYQDAMGYSDLYTRFTESSKSTKVGQAVSLQLDAFSWSHEGAPGKSETKNVTAAIMDKNGNLTAIKKAVMDKNGRISITFDKAGTYQVSAIGTAAAKDYNGNLSDCPIVAPAPCKVTVAKAASTIAVKNKTVTYTGKAVPSYKAVVKGSKGTVTYKYYTDAKCTKAVKAANVKNAGVYYVKATVAADAGYNAATSKAAKITIKKAAQSFKAITPIAKTYKAKALKKKAQSFTLQLTKKVGTGKAVFAKKSGNKNIAISKAGKVVIKKGTKKGTYKVTVNVAIKAGANYNATKVVTKQIVIKVK